VTRRRGLSVRLKLTLSYTGFLLLAGSVILALVWLILLGRGSFPHNLHDVFNLQIIVGGRGPLAFFPAATTVMIYLLAFGLVGGWFLAGRVLRPLDSITRAARLAADGSLDHRIRLPGRSDEFRELADTFDHMLARLQEHDARQRRFAATASHELRTPLAITQTLLDVARNDPETDTAALVDKLYQVNARAVELTNALLLLSRADAGAFDREPVDLSLLAEEVTETLLPLADTHRVDLQTSGDPAPTVGSPALLLQLVTNLVHNAIVHNLPDGGTVTLSTAVGPGSVSLVVENTGEQLDPRFVATLAEPFQRGTARIHDDQAGVGLGLAIATSIVRAHGGTLTLEPRTSGGLRATVRLPRTAPAPG
jgi:two-component system sensor histidine kinase VanS